MNDRRVVVKRNISGRGLFQGDLCHRKLYRLCDSYTFYILQK